MILDARSLPERDTDPTADPALAPTLPVRLPTPPAERRSFPRALLDRYEDVRFLGEGGMGTVYRARDPRLGRPVAIKLLKGSDPDMWRRFLGEARAQARIQHEHVCRVYEAGQAGDEPFIAMQLIDGEPLSKLAGRLTQEQRVKLVREVAAAVHEAHRLGMIHRDIKPGNILVERLEDGTWKPYIVDFGLAREVEAEGQTRTGAVVGTPAYMPPEQALGDVRATDRRSDVYSLGATLYDAIAGQPPFTAEHPWKLLLMVAYEDPPALGKVKKGVPEDLETIVMKCLEREPSRRYDSARALAEDLQRFLDGEPILGKRASLGYVAWKKARKHRLATAFAAAALAASLFVSVAWVRAGRRAAEQARLAQTLGENVKEMELFLRYAYGRPLHDVEQERDVVRARLAEIERRMTEAGEVGVGPGHYALGRGALALGDPEGARTHLEKAREAGYSSPELQYALGRALGELFRRALEETHRITNAEERRRKVAALEVALRDPALVHLRAAVAAKIEVPAYAEGLIALHEGKNEDALAKGKEAFEKAPWMYEARKLQGDALYAMGSRYRHDAAFDHEKMTAYFEPAAEAYRAAAEEARSDPEAHRAECELWEKRGQAESTRGLSARAFFDAADAACARAVQASHADGRARVQRALVMSAATYATADRTQEEALRAADTAVRVAEEAARVSPGDVMAHYAVARALSQRTAVLLAAGRPASMESAIAAYRTVVALDPLFTWAVNELGQAHLLAARIERLAGRDARPALLLAGRWLDQASALDPAFSLAVQDRMKVLAALLEGELERGTSSDESVDAVFRALPQLEQRKGAGAWSVAYWKAKAHILRGQHELSLGKDPGASAGAARAAIRAFAGGSTSDPWLLTKEVEALLLLGEQALRSGVAAGSLVAEMRAARRRVTEEDAARIDRWSELGTRIELLALRDASRANDVRDASFERLLASSLPALRKENRDPLPFQLAAEVQARRAAWLVKRGRDPTLAVEAGLGQAGEALSRNPHMAAALATRGSLLLTQAQAARAGAERDGAAARAKEAFDAAFHENPRLTQEHRANLDALARYVR